MKKLLIMAALAAVLIIAVLISSTTFAAGGLVDQSIDALYNLRDQLQDVVMKSVKGVGEAMQEGPPRDDSKPWTLEDLEQLQKKNANIEKLNSDLAAKQQKLLDINAAILKKLPPNDPRRAEAAAKIKELGGQIPATRASAKEYAKKLTETNTAIERWKAAHALPPTPTGSPDSSPAAAAVDDEVIVPNLAVFESVTEMKAALAHAGLSGTLVAASEKPPSKAKEFKFVGQAPAPGTKVKRGSGVAIAFYQEFEPADDEVTVPNLAAFESATEMKAVLAHAGLTGTLVAASEKPPSKAKEFKFAGQAPAPDTKVKKGSTVSIAFYQKFETEAPTAAAAGDDDFIGTWSGTLKSPEGSGPVTYTISKQGKQYFVAKPGGKPASVHLQGGKLVEGVDLSFSAGAAAPAGGTIKSLFVLSFERSGDGLLMKLIITDDKTGRTADYATGMLKRQ